MLGERRRNSAADRYDDERKEVLDPHHAEEIGMLARSLADPVGLSPQGIEVTRSRLEILRRQAPFYDGKRMIKDTVWWPCRCALCLAAEQSGQRKVA
jgi:hypothetical protein